MARVTLNQLLAQALSSIQGGDGASALRALRALPPTAQRDPNVLHVLGLAHKSLGELDAAADALERAVAAATPHAPLLNNFANVLNDLGDRARALETYRKALALDPNFVDAQRNLGIVLTSEERHEEALALLQRAHSAAPEDARTLAALAVTLNALERPAEAEALLRQLLRRRPDYPNGWFHLAVTLRQLERLDEALDAFERALDAAPESPEVANGKATLHFERGEYSAAEEHYLRAITKRPAYVDAHETLNEFYWQLGKHERYSESYRQVHAEHGWQSPTLAAAWVRALLLANRHDDALRVASDALAALGPSREVLSWKARVLRAQGDLETTLATLDQALALTAPLHSSADDVRLRQDRVEILLRCGHLPEADSALKGLLILAPDDQLTWALCSTAWRLRGDERYQWLHQDYRYVRAWTLPTPPGYSNLEEFLGDLSDCLETMHRMVTQPLAQTLEGGTQTPGRLLHKPHPTIQALKGAITSVVNAYVDELPPDDGDHPLLRRKAQRWRFSGSWSVRLRPDGFHVDHVHPAGWISSSCYVVLPGQMREQAGADDGLGGCIRFGRSSLALETHDEVERTIRPTPGLLVLFPSFTWHGTVPFTGSAEEFRMTAPFDVVPA